MSVLLGVRKCCICGKTKGVMPFVGKYYHLKCFNKTKPTAKFGKEKKS